MRKFPPCLPKNLDLESILYMRSGCNIFFYWTFELLYVLHWPQNFSRGLRMLIVIFPWQQKINNQRVFQIRKLTWITISGKTIFERNTKIAEIFIMSRDKFCLRFLRDFKICMQWWITSFCPSKTRSKTLFFLSSLFSMRTPNGFVQANARCETSVYWLI